MDDFEWAAGSVIGREHQRLHKNNQDAMLVTSTDDFLIGIVADGCGSQSHSEVGAWLGVNLLAEAIAAHLPEPLTPETFHLLGEKVLTQLPKIANFQQYYLFTLLGFIAIKAEVFIFGCGDGTYAVNDEVKQLSFPKNAPPYLIYPDTKLELYEQIKISQIESFCIATDGIDDWLKEKELNEFWRSEKYFKNPDQVRRCLAIANKKEHLLKDDTTLITVRRNQKST
ncbi:protein phosphatase 2C domain-containing protein [[Limnothrix rosea] IAM M-220]|uniref:protein phosphatase 2C domain-containing protein n=1 Tax=[Limnothrix rosea] IAM M-220 TaxID=454133 RepID=UPI0009670371|nr:protein phosphatase 2C domain-containing protein [[Limnothrix rosea] IAM M-220]OKH13431.1 hypothetical protein NIES208_14960 [[Limnothrix rosea] IAM M-220]